MACAGNINLDGKKGKSKGIEDLVVGAPYDGPDHQGAVYIYLVSFSSFSLKYKNRVKVNLGLEGTSDIHGNSKTRRGIHFMAEHLFNKKSQGASALRL